MCWLGKYISRNEASDAVWSWEKGIDKLLLEVVFFFINEEENKRKEKAAVLYFPQYLHCCYKMYTILFTVYINLCLNYNHYLYKIKIWHFILFYKVALSCSSKKKKLIDLLNNLLFEQVHVILRALICTYEMLS